jgi:hypothetical protein
MAIISTVILGTQVVHAQTPANFQAPSTSIFTVVPTWATDQISAATLDNAASIPSAVGAPP